MGLRAVQTIGLPADGLELIKTLELAYAAFAKRFGQDKIDEIRNAP